MRAAHSDVCFHDVTLTHSRLVPWVFASVRDVKLPGTIYFVTSADTPLDPVALAYLASPFSTERPEFVCDYYFTKEAPDGAVLRAVVSGLRNLAIQHGAPSLRLMKPVSSDAESKILESEGFHIELESVQFHFSTKVALNYIHQQLATRVARQSIPDDIEVVDYNGPLRDQISRLCVREFGAMTHGHLGALGQLADGLDHSFSRAVSRRGRLVASLGVGVKGNLAVFEPLLISPDTRSSWAFPYVVDKVLSQVVDCGVENAKAVIHSSNEKIMNFMQHLDPQVEGYLRSYATSFDVKSSGGLA